MRKSDKNFDPFTELPVDGVVATCISIKVKLSVNSFVENIRLVMLTIGIALSIPICPL